MALLPAALAATALGAVALVGGIAATSDAASTPASDPVAAVSALDASSDPTPTPPALGWRWFDRLDATQRACMDKATISRPIGPLSDAEKNTVQAQLRAAADACGIKVPTGERRAKVQAWWNGLSPTQQACLKKANLTRPVGPLSADERRTLRQQVVAAAKTCNVTLPKPVAAATSSSTATPSATTT